LPGTRQGSAQGADATDGARVRGAGPRRALPGRPKEFTRRAPTQLVTNYSPLSAPGTVGERRAAWSPAQGVAAAVKAMCKADGHAGAGARAAVAGWSPRPRPSRSHHGSPSSPSPRKGPSSAGAPTAVVLSPPLGLGAGLAGESKRKSAPSRGLGGGQPQRRRGRLGGPGRRAKTGASLAGTTESTRRWPSQ